jgi:hypothetical protein
VIAPGESSILLGSASGGVPPYTYKWSPSTGLSDKDVDTPSASPTVTVIYTLQVTDSLGATAADTVAVIVDTSASVEEEPDDVQACAQQVGLTNLALFWTGCFAWLVSLKVRFRRLKH